MSDEPLIEFTALDGSRCVVTRSDQGQIAVEKVDDALTDADTDEAKEREEWVRNWLA